MTPTEKGKCKNKALKKDGKFYVKKETIPLYYLFTASTKPDGQEVLSDLKGKSGGICDMVATRDENSQGCGLAKYLMATCFQDNSILGEDERGVDIRKDDNWADETEKSNNAINYCKTIIYLRCLPYGIPKPPSRVCISYLRAGSLANFNILFSTYNNEITKGPLNVFKLGESLEEEFNNDADKFIREYGWTWYFCKCKEDMKDKCMDMAENSH